MSDGNVVAGSFVPTGISSQPLAYVPIHDGDTATDRRLAKMEAIIAAHGRELQALRTLIMSMTTLLRQYEGDNR